VEDGPPGADPAKLGKSYLALDTDGRVIRTDSFSKIVAPGFRTGWVTAAKPFRDRLSLYMLSSTMGTCSLSASMMYELLESWGEEGFDAHLKRLQKDYGDKSRTIIEGFEKHMKGLGEWVAPRFGPQDTCTACMALVDAVFLLCSPCLRLFFLSILLLPLCNSIVHQCTPCFET